MLLWVGLGNPEPGMARQRHNIGFMAIDVIARRHGFSPWRQRFKGMVAEGVVGGEKILALRPLTYMNLSGESVQAAAGFFKIEPPAITVFHDELDLGPGKVRVKRGGGAAGHNGLRSMDQMLGSPDYWRVRLGIGHPGDKNRVTGYVLSDFSKEDLAWLLPCLDAVADAAALLVEQKAEEFMTRVALAAPGKGAKNGL
jgi:PTH1 family peptidyl-tRNA hydrolase